MERERERRTRKRQEDGWRETEIGLRKRLREQRKVDGMEQ